MSFSDLTTVRNLVRHDEGEWLYGEVRKLRAEAGEDWYELHQQSGSAEPLSQREVWNLAIEEALLCLDERLTWLREQ